MKSPRVHLTEFDAPQFGRRPLLARHNLGGLDLFSEQAIVELLDRFPRKHLYAWATGLDHSLPEQNRLADQDGVSGAELLRAIKAGRFWVNITRIDRVDSEYRKLIERIYEELAAQVPGFTPLACQGAVLLSSPHCVTYYHADAWANMLWHIRGRKRIWIYPAMDERFLKREALEDIYAGVRHEYLEYASSMDEHAVVFDVAPGQWVSWPHNAPHRVTNLDELSVSLATEHFTAETVRRERLFAANRFLRTRLHWRHLSAQETGPLATLKIMTHRVARRFGMDPLEYKRYVPVVKVDADAPNAIATLPTVGEAT